MMFDDDEQISCIQHGTAGFENEVTVGKSKVKIINVPYAQPEEGKLKVLVELTGKGKPNERPGLDLVIVLDVSQNMNRQHRLEKVKKATEFVIKKLSPIDRVSVVTFSQVANKLCALRQINKDSQKDIFNVVNGITSADGQNTSDGLEMALQVLSGRKIKENRSVGIILMSSDEQDGGRNAVEVEAANIPVYTFGFGTGNKENLTMPHLDDQVLDAIARKSAGGTYSDVQNGDDLSVAFAHCFVGLMTMAVQDLKLIISPENMSTIENVYAGDHEQSRDDYTVSVMLGNLYDKETRKVLVHVLPPVTSVVGLQVLKVAYKYRNGLGKERKSTPLYASKKQIQNFTQEEIDDLTDEVIHLERAHMMNEAKTLAYINSPIGEESVNEETVPPSSAVADRGDAGNQKQAKSLQDNHTNLLRADEDNVEEDTITVPSCKGDVAEPFDKVDINLENVKRETTLHKDAHQKQGKSFEKDKKNPLPSKNENVNEKAVLPSSKVVASGELEIPLLFTSPCTNEEDPQEDIITPSSKVAARGYMQKLLLLFTKLLVFLNLRNDLHQNQGDLFAKDFKKEITPPSEVAVTARGYMEILSLFFTKLSFIFNLRNDARQKQGELFESDYMNPLPTNKENVKVETTPPPSESAASGDVKKPPLFSTLCADENVLKEETITPSFKVAARGYMEKLVLLFTKLLFFPRGRTHQEGESLEEVHPNLLPTNEENVNEENTQPSSKVATGGDAHQKQAELSDKNHPSLLPTDEDDLKDRTTTTPSKVAARGYMEKLVLLFTKLLMFLNMCNRKHLEGESLKKDHTSSLLTNEENVNKENTQPSSKVAISGDAHQKQAQSSNKNHSNILPTDEDNSDRTIAIPSKVTARDYMEKLLLFFTPRMDTNQKREESFRKDYTSSLSTDGHHEYKHQDFISKVTRIFIGIPTGISNGVVTQTKKTWRSFQELGAIAIAYSYFPILLFQDTHRSPPTEFKTVMQVTLLSVAAASVLYMLCLQFSYAEFRDLALPNNLYGSGLYNPFCLLDIAVISIIFLLVGAYQVYYQPLFVSIDKHAARIFPNNDFIIKAHDISLPSGFKPFKLNLFRLVWRTIFVIITTIILRLIPFFKDVVDIVGAFGFWPLTVYYLVDMYIVQKKIPEWSTRWICLQILSVACLIIATEAGAGSFAAVITDRKVCRPFQTSY